jgi:hypothetical protein
MKNLILIVILCLFTSAYSQEEISENPVEIIFSAGRFPNGEGEGCKGRGSCGFTTGNSVESVNAQIYIDKEKNLKVHINRDKISLEDEIKIVGQEITINTEMEELSFIMEDELSLNKEVTTALKITDNLTTIPIGEFPIQVTEKEFIITLKLI